MRPATSGVPDILASVTVLSEAAMAKEAASGVPAVPILGDQSHARVMLWDEMKTPPETPAVPNNTVTFTNASPGK